MVDAVEEDLVLGLGFGVALMPFMRCSSSSAFVMSMGGLLRFDDEASALRGGVEEETRGASIASKAARAMPNGVEGLGAGRSIGEGVLSRTGILSDSIIGTRSPFCFSSTGVADNDRSGDRETKFEFFLCPPPKKLLSVVCRPLNSSRNLVANRGGSGAVRGGSVG